MGFFYLCIGLDTILLLFLEEMTSVKENLQPVGVGAGA